jgi:hypothetical protein
MKLEEVLPSLRKGKAIKKIDTALLVFLRKNPKGEYKLRCSSLSNCDLPYMFMTEDILDNDWEIVE